MIHPVGNLPARVYWRRRLVFVGLPLLVIVLLLWVTLSGGSSHPSSRRTSSTTTEPSASGAPPTSAQPRDSGSIGVSTTSTSTSTSASAASAPATAAGGKGFCTAGHLDIAAGTAKKTFAVKSQPGLSMLVTNTSDASCKLDVADKHVEWQIYAGGVRVWGSHDCAVAAGSHVVTLTARQAIRLSISWSGLTSQPKCAGTRMAVQPGTYTLFAYLNGTRSPATTFAIQ